MMNTGALQSAQNLKLPVTTGFTWLFLAAMKCTGKPGGKIITVRWFVIKKEPWAKIPVEAIAIPQTPGPVFGGMAVHPVRRMAALTGQISWGDATGSILVPDTYKNLRFWRNTSIATLGSGQTATLPNGTLGYEFDFEQYPLNNPAGRIQMSSTTLTGKTHKLSLYRHASGAWVFGAGTVQWSWGLDENHDRGNEAPSVAMQQATVNLFADMGVQFGG